jgi:hypothetical protein
MAEATYDEREGATGWVGWIVFAATIMIIGGSLNMIYGLIAAINDEWVVFGNGADLYLDLSEWGWIHLVLGAVVLLAGLGLLSGNVLARTVGVVVAAASIIANFVWLPAYPIWGLIIITMDVLVIWALTAHGREMRA